MTTDLALRAALISHAWQNGAIDYANAAAVVDAVIVELGAPTDEDGLRVVMEKITSRAWG